MVTYARTGNILTVTITQDVSDLAGSAASEKDKILAALLRCHEQLEAAQLSHTKTIDDQIAALSARKAALPAPLTNKF